MAGGHQVTGFLVGAETNLYLVNIPLANSRKSSKKYSPEQFDSYCKVPRLCSRQAHLDYVDSFLLIHSDLTGNSASGFTYRRHYSLALEAPSHSIIDTLGFPPACVNAFVSVALVSIEALSVYVAAKSASILHTILGKYLHVIAMKLYSS